MPRFQYETSMKLCGEFVTSRRHSRYESLKSNLILEKEENYGVVENDEKEYFARQKAYKNEGNVSMLKD